MSRGSASRPGRDPRVGRIYGRLMDAFGPQGWWPVRPRPGEAPAYHPGTYRLRDPARSEEIAIGAVLAQATAWKNAARAVEALAARGALALGAIAAIPEDELAEVIRPSGYFRQKARRLAALARALGGDGAWRRRPTGPLRRLLLSVPGIGPETADSILLYALGRPVFVVDAYARRILSRVGLCADRAGYDALQALFHASLERDPRIFNEYHALLVELGKRRCRRRPICAGCPLAARPVLCACGAGCRG